MYARYTGIGVGHYAQYHPPTSADLTNNLGTQCELPTATTEDYDGDTFTSDVKSTTESDSDDEPEIDDYDDSEDDSEDTEPEEDGMGSDFASDEDGYGEEDDCDGHGFRF